jgi:hypothetical protein
MWPVGGRTVGNPETILGGLALSGWRVIDWSADA